MKLLFFQSNQPEAAAGAIFVFEEHSPLLEGLLRHLRDLEGVRPVPAVDALRFHRFRSSPTHAR
jgi:hypothetical protein